MKMKELQEKTIQELHQQLAASRDAVRMMRFKVASQELKDVRELREARKTIARVMTLLAAKN